YIEEDIRGREGIINGRKINDPHLFDGVDANRTKEKLIEYGVYEDFLYFVRKAIRNPLLGGGFGTGDILSQVGNDLYKKAWNKQPEKEVERRFFWKKYKVFVRPEPDMEGLTITSLIKLINEVADTVEREMEIERRQAYTITETNTVDSMDGYSFEGFMKNLFEEMGYIAKATKMSGDMGADLILHEGDKKIVVQLKNHTANVGVKAIQEVVAAVNYYEADDAMVVITSYFTPQAIGLAKSNDVKLIDRDELDEWIKKYGYS
ncbi:MAG: restriction endonuclease, partial [Desulfobacterales bacterium]|nr:restriction endonuclease [Desulfobacterales bacterium]